ncbi:short chain dehydrogenase [Lentithecium fluviatile CBS 122367]|uniref:Short chain dehydrogenase n=1 Tax=Lentithecium fluviatile CBS 122367 TaxID=1168545 RepID=A0A6G1IV51_9PLEO|nr:short chain dehydrogenase [Lentithecium fluviatile CBS 122367]
MPSFSQFVYNQKFKTLPKPTTTHPNKTILITGSNVGLGKEAARHFTQLGASTVILAVRSLSKGEAAKADIEATTGRRNVVQVRHLDMSSYESCIDFVEKIEKEVERLDVVVLNAGVARGEWEMMADDESTITVNVVSTFLLALSLLPKMKKTANRFNTRPTLTIVASEVHFWAKFPEKDAPEGKIFTELSTKKEGIDMANRYQVSKLLDVLCTRAMADRKAAQAIPVTINTVNPGFCYSELSREGGWTFKIMLFLLGRTTEAGSRNLVYAGSAGAETHGQYISDCTTEMPSEFVLSREGYEVQNRVWAELCEKLEKIKPGVTANL